MNINKKSELTVLNKLLDYYSNLSKKATGGKSDSQKHTLHSYTMMEHSITTRICAIQEQREHVVHDAKLIELHFLEKLLYKYEFEIQLLKAYRIKHDYCGINVSHHKALYKAIMNRVYDLKAERLAREIIKRHE